MFPVGLDSVEFIFYTLAQALVQFFL